jgi:hypothetical protein
MLSEFFDITKDSKELFKDMKISNTEYMKYMNQSPVIFIIFKDCKGEKRNIINSIKYTIKKEYQRYKYIFSDMDVYDQSDFDAINNSLLNNEKDDLYNIDNSLLFLSKKLYEYYNKRVIILIDEYDTPFIEAKVNHYYDEIHDSLSVLLSSSLKGNEYLDKAVLTGIQRVAKENIFSGLNNLTVCSVDEDYLSEYFGFTTQETKGLLEYYGLELNDDVKNMYNGYRIGNHDIYNPWSIINYADIKKLKNYWVNTSSNKMIRDCMKNMSLNPKYAKKVFKQYLQLLLDKEFKISLNLTTSFYEYESIQSFWSLFVNSGYLTIIDYNEENNLYSLKIPNKEVREEFKLITSDYMNADYNDVNEMVQYLLTKDIESFIESYESIMLDIPSYYDLKEENSYHMFLLGILTWLSPMYEITSNREEGLGRYDIRLISKNMNNPHILIEMKYTKNDNLKQLSIEGLEQIKEMKYDNGLSGTIIYISLAHKGKEIEGSYEIKKVQPK